MTFVFGRGPFRIEFGNGIDALGVGFVVFGVRGRVLFVIKDFTAPQLYQEGAGLGRGVPQVRRSLDVNRARGVRVRFEPVGKVDRRQIEDDVGPNIDQTIGADTGRRVEFRQAAAN